jgi:hypothetical protein
MERQRDNRERYDSTRSVVEHTANRSVPAREEVSERPVRRPEMATQRPIEAGQPKRGFLRQALRDQLTSRRTLRQAIALREIIGPPKALRGPADS